MRERYLESDLSLLRFQERVLQNACDSRHPLYMRFMFLSIVSKNIDEYYMLKFPYLKERLEREYQTSNQETRSHDYVQAVSGLTQKIIDSMYNINRDLLKELQEKKTTILEIDQLDKKDLEKLKINFVKNIKPFLTPTVIDSTHPFPLIPSSELGIIYKLKSLKENISFYMIIMIPRHLERVVTIQKNGTHYLLIEDVLNHFMPLFMPAQTFVEDYSVFKAIRDSAIQIDEEIKNMSLSLGAVFRQRKGRKIIKVYVTKHISQVMQNFIIHNLKIKSDDFIKVDRYLGLEQFAQFISSQQSDLSYAQFVPRFPKRIEDFGGDYFRAIEEKDILVHHPFETFDVFTGFLNQAARDPNVAVIKQTLYRTGMNSTVVNDLITASQSGKKVVALVELRARMDEENNIFLAKHLEENGVQVVYGTLEFKTHAKLCLVVRKTQDCIQEYLHIGTGNYHPFNAKVYTDFSFFTCDPAMCDEANNVFNYITGFVQPIENKNIFTSPINVKTQILKCIEQEILNYESGKPSGIWLKCNGLSDKDIIDALYQASQKGVMCELIVRGICTLIPGVKNLSHNIRVRSVVGRFLEHSRLYCFANGAPMLSPQNLVYIASADLMSRNLDYRIEVMAQMKNPTVIMHLTKEVFTHYMMDNVNAWDMHSDGSYALVQKELTPSFDAHEYFMTHESLSGRHTRF